MRGVLRWGLLVAQAACIEPAWAPPDPVPVALLTPDVWSGGEAVLASAAFTPDLGLPVVLLNADTLVVRRLDDTTVVARLPDLPGTHVLHVLAPDVLDLPIAIELRGFESAGYGPLLSGRLQVLPGWPPSVVGGGVTTAVLWNLHSTITMALPDSVHDPGCSRGVGPGYGTGGVALVTGCPPSTFGRWWTWRLRPMLELVEDTLCSVSDRFVAALAPGVSASVSHHYVLVYSRQGSACTVHSPFVRAEETYDIVISPRGDRVVILAGNYEPLDSSPPAGVPVLDVATGQVAYGIGQIRYAPTAVFSAAGDTLFVAGDDESRQAQLVMVRASDGVILRSVPLPLNAGVIALDPFRPWLYVAGFTWPDRRGHLLVFDRDSLASVATLGAPDSISGYAFFNVGARLVPSPSEQRVFVVSAYDLYSTDSRAFLTRFRTPP